MKTIQFLFFVLFVSSIARAQIITGKLARPAANKPLAGASLTLTSIKDSSFIRNTVSNNTGTFQIQSLSLDSFFLKISSIGNEEYKLVVALHIQYLPLI